MVSTSSQNTVDSVDSLKALRTAAIALGAVFVTGGLQALLSLAENGSINLGKYQILTPLLVPTLTYLVDLFRRYRTDYTQ